jgi:hypothetical protein
LLPTAAPCLLSRTVAGCSEIGKEKFGNLADKDDCRSNSVSKKLSRENRFTGSID